MSNSGRDEAKGMNVVERNRMVVSTVFDPHDNDVECNRSITRRNGSSVGCKESDVDGSRRDLNGTGSDASCSVREVDDKQRIVNPSGGLRSDVSHSIFHLATLGRKKFAQHYQSGRKSIFTPETLLEKAESDKGDESDILEDDKIQLLDSLHMQQGRLTNLEIAFILSIRAITSSSTHIFRTIFPFVTAPTSALP